MRKGEIVRRSDGTILRKPTGENIPFGTYEVVTVAELFKAAGHPVPEGGNLYWVPPSVDGEECWCWENTSTCSTWDGNKWGQTVNIRSGFFPNGQAEYYIDQTRTPALDAWDALPEVIKAVAK